MKNIESYLKHGLIYYFIHPTPPPEECHKPEYFLKPDNSLVSGKINFNSKVLLEQRLYSKFILLLTLGILCIYLCNSRNTPLPFNKSPFSTPVSKKNLCLELGVKVSL